MPHELATILLRCLEKDPSDRYAGAAALADDLDRFLKGERIVAQPKGLAERGFEHVRRHKIMTALALVSVVAVATLLVNARLAFDRDLQAALLAIAGEMNLDRAVDRAEELLRKHPTRRDVADARRTAFVARARDRLEKGKFEEALSDWAAAGSPDAFWEPLVLVELNRRAEARVLVESRPADDPARALTLARIALAEGELLKAIEGLGELAADAHPLAYLTVGVAWMRLGSEHFDKAREAFELGYERSGKYRESWMRDQIEFQRENLRVVRNPQSSGMITVVGGAAREAFRNLTGFWADMSRRQETSAGEFVRAVLALAKLPPATLPAVLKIKAEDLRKTAREGPERVTANLLLGVAMLSGRAWDDARVAFEDAAHAGEDRLTPYALWGLSLCLRAKQDLTEAVSYAVYAIRAAETLDAFGDFRSLVENAVVLAEEALDGKQLDVARSAADHFASISAKRPDLAGIFAEFLRRFRAS